jgi:hypothetical protein
MTNSNNVEKPESRSDDTQQSSYEKLRDEVLEVKVDYRAWLRSLKVIALCVTIILAILAYFGYDKIESIESTAVQRVNERLAKTDSLISLIDEVRIHQLDQMLNELSQRVDGKEQELDQLMMGLNQRLQDSQHQLDMRLDSLNERIRAGEQEYELTLSNFERFVSKSKEVEEMLLQLLPVNERVDHSLRAYMLRSHQDYFEIRPLPSSFGRGQKVDVYLTFADRFDLARAKLLRLCLSEKGVGIHLRDYFFKARDYLNKMSFTLDVKEGDYVLEVGFIEVKNGVNHFYRVAKDVTVK